jgi:DNA polymerase-3 subunit alpha
METKKAEAVGQFDLFGSGSADTAGNAAGVFDVPVPEEYWEPKHQLALEREMLGLYVSGHPLNGVEQALDAQSDTSIPAILEGDVADGTQVTVGGILASVTKRVNRNGEPWALAQLEDLSGGIEVMLFPKAFSVFGADVVEDAIVLVKGRVAVRDDRTSLIAADLSVPDLSVVGPTATEKAMRLQMPAEACTEPVVARLKDVLSAYPGSTEVLLSLQSGPRQVALRLDEKFRVSPSPSLMGDLKALLGPGCLG